MQYSNTSKISAIALEKIGSEARVPGFYCLLRRVKHPRQEQIAELMSLSADHTLNFLRLLIAASKSSDFVKKKKRTRGITRNEEAAIEKTFRSLEGIFQTSAASYSDDAHAASLTIAYLRRLLNNGRIENYINAIYPELFKELKVSGELSLVNNKVRTKAVARKRIDRATLGEE